MHGRGHCMGGDSIVPVHRGFTAHRRCASCARRPRAADSRRINACGQNTPALREGWCRCVGRMCVRVSVRHAGKMREADEGPAQSSGVWRRCLVGWLAGRWPLTDWPTGLLAVAVAVPRWRCLLFVCAARIIFFCVRHCLVSVPLVQLQLKLCGATAVLCERLGLGLGPGAEPNARATLRLKAAQVTPRCICIAVLLDARLESSSRLVSCFVVGCPAPHAAHRTWPWQLFTPGSRAAI